MDNKMFFPGDLQLLKSRLATLEQRESDRLQDGDIAGFYEVSAQTRRVRSWIMELCFIVVDDPISGEAIPNVEAMDRYIKGFFDVKIKTEEKPNYTRIEAKTIGVIAETRDDFDNYVRDRQPIYVHVTDGVALTGRRFDEILFGYNHDNVSDQVKNAALTRIKKR